MSNPPSGRAPTKQAERRSRQRAANRTAILDAARRIAAQKGEGELSLRAVAAEAGYAPASIYDYFRNRAELLLALAAEDLSVLVKMLRENVKADVGEGKLSAAARVAIDALGPSAALAAVASALEGAQVPQEAERQFNGKLIGALTTLADVTDRSPLRSREEQLDVVLIASCIAGLSMLSRSGRLKALGYEQRELLARLERRFAGKQIG